MKKKTIQFMMSVFVLMLIWW